MYGEKSTAKIYGYEDEVTKYIIQRYERLKSERENWEDHWQEIIELVMPRKDTIWNRSKGEKRNFRVYDATQIHANEMLASALHSRLTNPSIQWFSLSTGDPSLDSLDEVKKYLQESTEVFHSVLNNSNFQTQVAEMYVDLCAINTSVLMVEEDDVDHMRFKASPIWDHYIDENYKGKVDTVFTEREMTVRQMLQEFGEDAFDLNDETKHKLEQLKRDPAKKVHVLHAVYPRTDRDVTKKGGKNMPFASVEVLLECNVKLKESGYQELPYIVSRFTVNSGEKYGRGPGTKALPDIKMLQEMVKVVIKVGQKVADPPLMAPDDGAYLPVKTSPGSINYYRAGGEDRISYLESRARADISLQMIERVANKIDQAYYIDQLKLIDRGPQMTATEVDTRNEQNMSLLAPVLARQHYEFLRPLIDRCFGILLRKDKLPEAPQILEGKELQVQYSSQIARAQKRSMLSGLQSFYNALAPLMEVDPNVSKLINGVEAGRYIADIMDIPVKVLNSEKQIEQMKQQEAEMQQKEMQNQELLTQSQAVKNLQGPTEALAGQQEGGEG